MIPVLIRQAVYMVVPGHFYPISEPYLCIFIINFGGYGVKPNQIGHWEYSCNVNLQVINDELWTDDTRVFRSGIFLFKLIYYGLMRTFSPSRF